MEKFEINAVKRTVTGKKVSVMRREGKLPGVIYGHKVAPLPIVMDLKEATKVLNKTTSSTIINIILEGKTLAALVRERQMDYMKNLFIHVDFQAVSLTEKLRTHVNLELSGIAPAVKDFSGVVVEGLSSVEVEALPSDLPERFVIDISGLNNIGDAIYVKDLQIPQGVEIHTPIEEMIVLITPPAGEEVEEQPVEAGVAEPEVIEKGKKEEEIED